jgi:hypothetical protein
MTTLTERIEAAPLNGLGFDADGEHGHVIVRRDARLYGSGSPWWGPSRIETLEVGFARVVLERLTVRDLWLRSAYLSSVRDVLVVDGSLRIWGDRSDPIEESPGAITLDGVHVRGGSVEVRSSNVVWTGGSIERTTGGIRFGHPSDEAGMVFVGVRFEHDGKVQAIVDSGAPVTFLGCHFTLTDLVWTRNAHPESRQVGCSFHTCREVNHRPKPRGGWWPF